VTARSFVIVKGKRLDRIAPGVYADGQGAMHIFADELLKAHGYADTEENRELVIREARALMRSANPRAPFEVVD
jgi:hypothetical protein